jgi:hypothetical protein
MIEKDIKDDFEPIILVANAGSYGIGQCDDLKRLNELCYKYNMWIHMEGFYLASLALYSIPTAIQVSIRLYIIKKREKFRYLYDFKAGILRRQYYVKFASLAGNFKPLMCGINLRDFIEIRLSLEMY